MFGTLCGENSSSLTENFCFDLNKEMAVVRAGNSECRIPGPWQSPKADPHPAGEPGTV